MCDPIMHFLAQELQLTAPNGRDFHVMDEIPIVPLHSHLSYRLFPCCIVLIFFVLSWFSRIVLASIATFLFLTGT